jgi:hypothetical protein
LRFVYDSDMETSAGSVVSILIGPEAKKPLYAVQSVRTVRGRGLEGDRYFSGLGSFNAPQFDQNVRDVTLIAAEAIDECNRRLDGNLEPAAFRRNIVTVGVDFRQLKGKRFRIGGTVFRYARTAPPCRYLSRLLGEDMMTALKGIGGIRAVVETDGILRIGDSIDVLS